jgi:hypothetical protein
MSVSKPKIHPGLFLALLIVTFFVVDWTAGAVLKALVRASDYRISRIYAGAAKADVLLLGNRVANAMAIPPDLEHDLHRSVFSIAAHGLDGRTQDAFVRDLIDNGGAPKVAVIEIRPILSPSVQAPAFSTYQAFSGRLAGLIRETQKSPVPWARVFPLYAFNSPQLANVLQKIVDRDDQATGPSNGKINEAMKKRWLSKPVPKAVPAQVQALRESVLALQKAGSTVVVVAAPLSPVTRQKGPWMDEVIAAAREAMPPGAEVVDYTALLDDDRYFEDPIHMNKAGRAAFRKPLIELIARTAERGTALRGEGRPQTDFEDQDRGE